MAYEDLLPTAANVTEELRKAGLTSDQINLACGSVSNWLSEHAEYYRVQYSMHGEKSDDGAGTAIGSLADELQEQVH